MRVILAVAAITFAVPAYAQMKPDQEAAMADAARSEIAQAQSQQNSYNGSNMNEAPKLPQVDAGASAAQIGTDIIGGEPK